MRAVAALALAALLTACGPPPESAPVYRAPPDYGALSANLRPHMTEAEVLSVLGSPRDTELSTCGAGLGQPWTCKAWRYGGGIYKMLVVVFAQDRGGRWVVNGWNTF